MLLRVAPDAGNDDRTLASMRAGEVRARKLLGFQRETKHCG
jgi:hypothetical protein